MKCQVSRLKRINTLDILNLYNYAKHAIQTEVGQFCQMTLCLSIAEPIWYRAL